MDVNLLLYINESLGAIREKMIELFELQDGVCMSNEVAARELVDDEFYESLKEGHVTLTKEWLEESFGEWLKGIEEEIQEERLFQLENVDGTYDFR